MLAHPYADRFPMLGGEELDRLAADIAENGLRSPIVLDSEGRILDGRNRWAACEIAGVTPETVIYEGEDPAAFVLSTNVSRRHLTTGQQAMSTALVLSDAGKRENGRWKRGSVDTSAGGNISGWSQRLAEAGMILDHALELAEDVVSGNLALKDALREAESRREADRALLVEEEQIEAEEEAAREHLERTAPDYLAKHETARQALAAWEDDNRQAAAMARREKAAREAEEQRYRRDMTVTFTNMAEALLRINSIGRSPFDKYMERFDASYVEPPSLMRELDPEQLRKGIAFMNNLLAWTEARNV